MGEARRDHRSARDRAAAGLLELQRAAGNRATTAFLQRAPVQSGGAVTGYEFVVGAELTAAFAQAAKLAARGGALGPSALSSLRTAALAGDESVSDTERMFMAALLDAGNARQLSRARFGANGDRITFPAASISAARRAAVEAVDRPLVPSGITGLQQSAATAFKSFDIVGALGHLNTANAAAVPTLIGITGPYAPQAAKAMRRAQLDGVMPLELLQGMLRAASDGTPGDLALAAVALTIAHAEGLSTYDDLAAGRIKVDQVPASAMPGGATHNADYVTLAQGSGAKGDTIYLPSTFDIDNAFQWSVVVHELHHAADDQAAGGGKVQWTDKARLELAAFRAQGSAIIRRLAATSGAQQATMISQIAANLDPLLLGGIVLGTRTTASTADPLITKINLQLPPAHQIPAAQLVAVLATPVGVMETRMLALIAQAYGLAPGAQAPLDGLSGQSIADWITRV